LAAMNKRIRFHSLGSY